MATPTATPPDPSTLYDHDNPLPSPSPSDTAEHTGSQKRKRTPDDIGDEHTLTIVGHCLSTEQDTGVSFGTNGTIKTDVESEAVEDLQKGGRGIERDGVEVAERKEGREQDIEHDESSLGVMSWKGSVEQDVEDRQELGHHRLEQAMCYEDARHSDERKEWTGSQAEEQNTEVHLEGQQQEVASISSLVQDDTGSMEVIQADGAEHGTRKLDRLQVQDVAVQQEMRQQNQPVSVMVAQDSHGQLDIEQQDSSEIHVIDSNMDIDERVQAGVATAEQHDLAPYEMDIDEDIEEEKEIEQYEPKVAEQEGLIQHSRVGSATGELAGCTSENEVESRVSAPVHDGFCDPAVVECGLEDTQAHQQMDIDNNEVTAIDIEQGTIVQAVHNQLSVEEPEQGGQVSDTSSEVEGKGEELDIENDITKEVTDDSEGNEDKEDEQNAPNEQDEEDEQDEEEEDGDDNEEPPELEFSDGHSEDNNEEQVVLTGKDYRMWKASTATCLAELFRFSPSDDALDEERYERIKKQKAYESADAAKLGSRRDGKRANEALKRENTRLSEKIRKLGGPKSVLKDEINSYLTFSHERVTSQDEQIDQLRKMYTSLNDLLKEQWGESFRIRQFNKHLRAIVKYFPAEYQCMAYTHPSLFEVNGGPKCPSTSTIQHTRKQHGTECYPFIIDEEELGVQKNALGLEDANRLLTTQLGVQDIKRLELEYTIQMLREEVKGKDRVIARQMGVFTAIKEAMEVDCVMNVKE
jgi:hypothetical protein